MNETYTIQIERRSSEFEIIKYIVPEDAYGKSVLSFMLIRLAEQLNPNLIPDSAPGGDGA